MNVLIFVLAIKMYDAQSQLIKEKIVAWKLGWKAIKL